MFRKVGIAALLLLGTSLTASAEVVPERKALQVVNDVTTQVRRYTRFTIFDDVNVRIGQNGEATLTGAVTMPFKKDDIGRIVSQVAGVSSVDNQLAVLPVSPYDDELRFRIARAIYNNTAFWHYAAMAGVPALEASLLLLLEPVLNPVWSWVVHGEAPGSRALIGGAIILVATAARTIWDATRS